MKKKSFDGITLGISLLSAFFVLLLMMTLLNATASVGWVYRALMTGLIAAVTPLVVFLCVTKLSALRKRRKIHFPSLSVRTAGILLAALFLTGFVGQCLYSLRFETVAPQVEAKQADMMLLLDDSGSVNENGFAGAARRASERLIDGLSSASRLSAAVFTTKIDAFSNLCVMDNVGKDKLKSTIRAGGSGNGTNLVAALTSAYDTLTADDNGSVKTVILMTDGGGVVPSDLADAYAAAGVTVHVIRPDKAARFTAQLTAFAAAVGGSDRAVAENGSGFLADDVFTVITDICTGLGIGFSESAPTKITFSEGLLLHDTASPSVRLLDVLIRFAVFAVLSVLTQYLYFRKITPVLILINVISAAIACAAVTCAGPASLGIITIAAVSLCIESMAVRLQRVGEQEIRQEN